MAIAIATGATWLLYVSGLFILWTPLPLLLVFARRGFQPVFYSAALALTGMINLYIFLLPDFPEAGSFVYAVFVFPGLGLRHFFPLHIVQVVGLLNFFYYLLIAILLVFAHRQLWPLERSFFLSSLVPVTLCVGLLFMLANFYQMNVLAESKAYLVHLIERFIELGENTALESAQLQYLYDHREPIASQLLAVAPAGIVATTLFTSWCNVVLVRGWFPHLGLWTHWGRLTTWRIRWPWIWLTIGCASSYFLDYYLLQTGFLCLVAANGLFILAAIFFFHGLAIMTFFLQRRSSWLMRVIGYGLIILFFQVVAIVLVGLGFFDLWLDFRKLTKKPS